MSSEGSKRKTKKREVVANDAVTDDETHVEDHDATKEFLYTNISNFDLRGAPAAGTDVRTHFRDAVKAVRQILSEHKKASPEDKRKAVMGSDEFATMMDTYIQATKGNVLISVRDKETNSKKRKSTSSHDDGAAGGRKKRFADLPLDSRDNISRQVRALYLQLDAVSSQLKLLLDTTNSLQQELDHVE